MNVVHQGIIPTNGNFIITCPSSATSLTIVTVIINNPNEDYQVLASKSNTVSQTLLYRLNLDAGDRVEDTTEYRLMRGESFHLTSSAPNTSYYINVIEE